MANDGRIFITITDEPISNGRGKGTQGEKKLGAEDKAKNKSNEIANNQIIHFARSQMTQAMSYSLSNIGNFTGDYTMQRQAQELMSNVNIIANIGLSFYYGGVVGGAIAIAGAGINFAYQEYANSFNIKKQNYQIGRLRDISGLNTLTNGSR